MENYLKLRPMQRRFAELISEGRFRGAEAVREIRPDVRYAKQIAWRWLRNPTVVGAIEELNAVAKRGFELRKTRHLESLDNASHADRTQFLGLTIEQLKVLPQELKDCIESFKFKDGFLSEITLSNRNEAKKLYSQHMGWMAERHELTGKDGGPVQYEDVRDRNLRALDQISARLARTTPSETASEGAEPNHSGDDAG